VDNDDPGFRLITPNTKLLQRYLSRESRYTDGFYGMAPEMGSWGKIHAGSCHGEYIRNAHIKTEGSGSFKAEWRAEIPEEGVYEVFVWIPEISVSNVQSYTVSGEGMPDQSVEASVRRGTWNSLGQFDLKRGEALVVLSDRIPQTQKSKQPAIQGRGMLGKPRIVADAVKWVRVKN